MVESALGLWRSRGFGRGVWFPEAQGARSDQGRLAIRSQGKYGRSKQVLSAFAVVVAWH